MPALSPATRALLEALAGLLRAVLAEMAQGLEGLPENDARRREWRAMERGIAQFEDWLRGCGQEKGGSDSILVRRPAPGGLRVVNGRHPSAGTAPSGRRIPARVGRGDPRGSHPLAHAPPAQYEARVEKPQHTFFVSIS